MSAANCDLLEIGEDEPARAERVTATPAPADVVTERWRSIKAEVLRLAWTLYYAMDTNPAEILRGAAERATNDDKSRRPTRNLAAEIRPELERLIRDEPTKKKAVLLARIATSRRMKYETLRDILTRENEKKRRPVAFHYVRNPESLLSPEEAEDGKLSISLNRIRPDKEPEKGELWRVLDGLDSPPDKPDEEAEGKKRRGAPPHTTHLPNGALHLPKSAASRIQEQRKGALNERRTVTKHHGGGKVPGTRHWHIEAVEDAGRAVNIAVREGERKPGALLAPGARGVRGRAHEAPHRRPRPRRPRGVKKKRP